MTTRTRPRDPYMRVRKCGYCNRKEAYCRRLPNGLLQCVYCRHGLAEEQRARLRDAYDIQAEKFGYPRTSAEPDGDLPPSSSNQEEGIE